MKRIIDKNGLFLRDDTQWNENEVALDVEPNNDLGLYLPLWNGKEWIEGATEIPTQEQQAPSIEERVQALEQLELERMF